MKKIILTVGISGSGKSTWAKNYTQTHPNTINVERDQLRNMLFGYTDENIKDYYQNSGINILEKQITIFENNLIEDALDMNNSVVISNTHLKAKYLNRFDLFKDVEKEIVMFDISLEEAKERNFKRERQVDEEILVKQYNDYQNIKIFLTKNNLKFNYICIKLN